MEKHKHDCDSCVFLCTVIRPDGNQIDLYHCGGSIIGRHSSDGPDYCSGDIGYCQNPYPIQSCGLVRLWLPISNSMGISILMCVGFNRIRIRRFVAVA